ncbi:MAG: hypothetical protein ACHQK8_04340, partial [Bacteroidia bacterium]
GNIILILNNLSSTRSFIHELRGKNSSLQFILSGAMLLLLLINFIPALRVLFSFEFPGTSHFISSLTGAGILLFLFEGIKKWRNRKQVR